MRALSDEERLLPPDHGLNFRDFGGYATEDGGWVKPGMLYRAGLMAFVDEGGREKLRARGVVSICDLRNTRERKRNPTRWHEPDVVELWARDYGATTADLVSSIEKGISDPVAMRARMIRLYETLPYDHAESWRGLFGLLLAGKVPLLVNCSAGKDRTGTAVALVLSALGVPRDTILADYLLTQRADFSTLLTLTRQAQNIPDAEVAKPLLAADADYLNAMFAALDARSGGVRPYLADVLGVGVGEIARLRELLVDG